MDTIKDIKLNVDKQAHTVTLSFQHKDFPINATKTINMKDINKQLKAYNSTIVKNWLKPQDDGIALILQCLDAADVVTESNGTGAKINVSFEFDDAQNACYIVTLTIPILGYGYVDLDFGQMMMGANVNRLYYFATGKCNEIQRLNEVIEESRCMKDFVSNQLQDAKRLEADLRLRIEALSREVEEKKLIEDKLNDEVEEKNDEVDRLKSRVADLNDLVKTLREALAEKDHIPEQLQRENLQRCLRCHLEVESIEGPCFSHVIYMVILTY